MGNYKTYTVQKGSHNFKPDTWAPIWWKKGIHWNATFKEGCSYNLVDEDQKDWNKLVGITYSFNPTKKTVMVGWRWNRERNKIELNAYYHVNGNRYFTEPLARISLDEKCWGNIKITKKNYEVDIMTISRSGKTTFKKHTYPHRKNPRWIGRLINPWFGGNEKAPNKMKLEMGWQIIK